MLGWWWRGAHASFRRSSVGVPQDYRRSSAGAYGLKCGLRVEGSGTKALVVRAKVLR